MEIRPLLHAHSYYSFRSGLLSPVEVADACAKLGYSHVALTDRNSITGIVPFYKRCLELGIHPLIGVELEDYQKRRIRILCSDWSAYGTMNRIVTGFSSQSLSLYQGKLSTFDTNGLFFLSDDADLLDVYHESLSGQIFGELVHAASHAPNRKIVHDYCIYRHIPHVVTTAAYLPSTRMHKAHSLLRAIDRNIPWEAVTPDEWHCMTDQLFVESGAFTYDLNRLYPGHSNVELALKLHVKLPLNQYVFPRPSLPEGQTEYSYFVRLCWEGIQRKYPAITQDIVDRFYRELGIIHGKGFIGYFLLIWDMCQYAKGQNFPYVCRGSAMNSLVCYALDISQSCPIKHNLYFDRFMSTGKVSPPDIDIDFAYHDWRKIRDYLTNVWGAKSTAAVCNVVTFGERGAIRVVAKAMGLDMKRAKLIAHGFELPPTDTIWRRALSIARFLQDFPSHLAPHPGGIVAVPGQITDYSPVVLTRQKLKIIQLNKDMAEDIGLVKSDPLALAALVILKKCRAAFQRLFPAKPLPPDDCGVILRDSLIRERIRMGDSWGQSHLESISQQNMTRKLQADSIDLLCLSCSAIRPGVSEEHDRLVENRRRAAEGRPIDYLHPSLIPVLKETFGCFVYQEQIMRVADDVLDLGSEIANRLRKGLGNQDYDSLNQLKNVIIRGAMNKNFTVEEAQILWKRVSAFEGYSFPKGHSLSRVIIGVQQAVYAHYYPSIFFSAHLNYPAGYYGRQRYLSVAVNRGVKLHRPRIDRSPVSSIPGRKSIRMGLGGIRHVSKRTLRSLIEERRRVPLEGGLLSFASRVSCSSLQLFHLLLSGTFLHSQTFTESLADFREVLKERNLHLICDASLLEDTRFNRAQLDIVYHGACLDGHPADLLFPRDTPLNSRYKRIDSRELDEYLNQRVSVVGWGTTVKHTRLRKRKESMAFFSLEDAFGVINSVLFPQAWERSRRALDFGLQNMFLLEGRVKLDCNVVVVEAERLIRIGRHSIDNVKAAIRNARVEALPYSVIAPVKTETAEPVDSVLNPSSVPTASHSPVNRFAAS